MWQNVVLRSRINVDLRFKAIIKRATTLEPIMDYLRRQVKDENGPLALIDVFLTVLHRIYQFLDKNVPIH